MELGAAIIRLEADASSVMGQIRALKDQVKGETDKVAKDWDQSWGGMGKSAVSSLKTVGALFGVSLGVAGLVSGFKSAVGAALEFEDQMDRLESKISAADVPALESLEQGILNLSTAWGIGTDGLTTAAADILDASIPPTQALGLLNDAAILAKGGVFGIQEAAANTVTVLKAYNMEATESGRVTDLFANAAERGRGGSAAISGGLATLAKDADTAGISLEELGAIISTATRNGMPLEKAMFGIKTLLPELTKENEKAAAAGEKYNVSLGNGKLAAGEFTQIIQKLATASQEDRDAIVDSQKARTLFNTILGDSAGFYRDVTVEMVRSGTAMEVQKRVTDDAGDSLKRLEESGHLALKGIGDGIILIAEKSGVLDSLVGTLMDVGDSFSHIASGPVDDFGRAVSGIASDVDTAIDAYSKQTSTLTDLSAQYETLQAKLADATPGSAAFNSIQGELFQITQDIAAIVPQAVDQWDDYGNAVSIDVSEVKRLTDSQRELLKSLLESKKAQAELALITGKGLHESLIAQQKELAASLKSVSDQVRFNQQDLAEAEETQGKYSAGWISINNTLAGNITQQAGLQASLAGVNADLAQFKVNEETLKVTTEKLNDLTGKTTLANDDYDAGLKKSVETAKKVVVVEKELADARKHHLDIMESVDWSGYYQDQERLSGRTTQQIIADIDRLLEKYKQEGDTGSESYRNLMDLRVTYTEKGIEAQIKAEQEAADKIADIWGGVSEDFKSSLADLGADALLGDADLSAFGDKLKESFAHGFSQALIEKAGFDLKFKNNMLDLGGSVSSIFGGGGAGGGGLLGGLGKGFSAITDALGLTSSEAAFDLATLSEAQWSAYESGMSLTDAMQVGVDAIEVAGTAAEGTTTALGGMGAAASAAGISMVGWAAIAAIVVNGTVQGIEDIHEAWGSGDKNLAEKFGRTAIGLTKIIWPATALTGTIAGLFGASNETADKISDVTAAMAIGTAVAGPFGAALAGLWASGNIGGSHVTFEEQFGTYLEDFKDGTMSQEDLFRQTYLRMTSYATDFWGTQEDLLSQDYASRKAYYDKFAGMGIFSEEQLSKMRDALQLAQNETERAAQASRTAFEVAGQVIQDKFFNQFRDSAWMMDSITGWQDQWKSATEEAGKTGGDVWTIFEQKMSEMPGMTADVMAKVRDSIAQLRGEVDLTIDTKALDDSFRGLAETLGSAMGRAGQDVNKFTAQVESVATKWLEGMNIDLGENLKNIPGMNDDMVSKLRDELVKMKDEGITTFDLGEDFEKRLREAAANPAEAGKGEKGKGPGKGGLLLSSGEELGLVLREQVIPELTSFVGNLVSSGQGVANLSEQQASSILNLIGAEDSLANRQLLVGQSADQTSTALNTLISSTYGTAEGTNNLGDGYSDLVGEIGTFNWGNWMLPVSWEEYIKQVNLENFVEGVRLKDFIEPAKSGKGGGRGSFQGESNITVHNRISIGNISTGANRAELMREIEKASTDGIRKALKELN